MANTPTTREDMGQVCSDDSRGDQRRVSGGDCGGGAGSRRLRGGAGTRRVAAAAAFPVKFKLDENLPVSSGRAPTGRGHDVDTVTAEGLTGAGDPDVVAAAAAEARGSRRHRPTGSPASLESGWVAGTNRERGTPTSDGPRLSRRPGGRQEALACGRPILTGGGYTKYRISGPGPLEPSARGGTPGDRVRAGETMPGCRGTTG